MIITLGGFKALIIIGVVGAAVLMAMLLINFVHELKKNEIW